MPWRTLPRLQVTRNLLPFTRYRIENFIEHCLETCSNSHQGQRCETRGCPWSPPLIALKSPRLLLRFRGPLLHGYVQVRERDARMSWSPPLNRSQVSCLLLRFRGPPTTRLCTGQRKRRADVLVPSFESLSSLLPPSAISWSPQLHGYVQVRERDGRMSWSPPLNRSQVSCLLLRFCGPPTTRLCTGQRKRHADVLVPSFESLSSLLPPSAISWYPNYTVILQVRERDARMSWSPPLNRSQVSCLLLRFLWSPNYTAMYRSEKETRGCPGPLL